MLTAALDTQAYSDHWGPRCDVFDIPRMDKRAYLRPSSDAMLAFHVVPAATLSLARVFYRRTKAVAGVRWHAKDPEWGVKHAYHLGFMSTEYAWTTGDIDIDRYLATRVRSSLHEQRAAEGDATSPGSTSSAGGHCARRRI